MTYCSRPLFKKTIGKRQIIACLLLCAILIVAQALLARSYLLQYVPDLAPQGAEMEATVKRPFSERAVAALKQCRLRNVGHGTKGYHTIRIGAKTIAFRHITKAGSSTLTTYVSVVRQDLNQTRNVKFHLEEAIDALRVAFVRDPVDRFVSAYMEILTPSRGYKPHYEDVQEDFDHFFDRYLEGNYSDGRYTIKFHFMAQAQFLTHSNGDGISLDYIGRTEHLNEEWNSTFKAFLPVDIPALPQTRARITEANNTKPVMRPYQIRHICQLYCHDYCCLGMEFPLECRDHQNTTSESGETGTIGNCPNQPIYSW
eukprot:CAMPEP_0197840468 /NCGR_PEP_ID=MMETSP1437-20131217/45627_1 /TAXON_ID=49252 ORGANISM="Eucampia antarctica, Strain CCMP1452" /NCGR_SAMPLE_ID=MMETSP1437 /ASSEMBLY_ACC=CAM_ASM_001096 /LENGTH=312 /DNA_ID=CAMNT_0043450091 /DNA_START=160 /DNA_END=1095 /DNA_ORIENTATION=+